MAYGFVRVISGPYKGRRFPIHSGKALPRANRVAIYINIPTRYDSCLRDRSPADLLPLDKDAEQFIAGLQRELAEGSANV